MGCSSAEPGSLRASAPCQLPGGTSCGRTSEPPSWLSPDPPHQKQTAGPLPDTAWGHNSQNSLAGGGEKRGFIEFQYILWTANIWSGTNSSKVVLNLLGFFFFIVSTQSGALEPERTPKLTKLGIYVTSGETFDNSFRLGVGVAMGLHITRCCNSLPPISRRHFSHFRASYLNELLLQILKNFHLRYTWWPCATFRCFTIKQEVCVISIVPTTCK